MPAFIIPLIIVLVVIIVVAILVRRSLLIIPQANAIVVERLGKFNRVSQSGVRFVIPFVELIRPIYFRTVEMDVDNKTRLVVTKVSERIDLREQVLDFPKQSVITKDNVTMGIDAVLYYMIREPEKAVYGISNLGDAIEKVVQTSLRNVVGQLTLDETLTSRETINSQLRFNLDEATAPWGVQVVRVELQEISPSTEIRQRMELQMTAEREKRAEILRAEGKKQSAVLEAEGAATAEIRRAEAVKQAKILEAEGIGSARLTIAQAEAEALQSIETRLGKQKASEYLITLKYLESLTQVANGQATKLFLPYEATGILGALGGIREMLNPEK
jgi:regulator of protease activity HflC (stomatin/prohibitin superfamily)